MNTDKREDREIEPGQDWEVDLFRPEDARGVTDLFLSVYGRGYPIRTYIEPERLIEENAAGRVISSVARTPKGDIVGHNALFHSAPYRGIWESGAGVVHRDYRGGKGIFTRLVAHGKEVGPGTFDVEGIYGESVCNHVFSQKLCHGLGLVTHAVEADLMPATAYTREKSAPGRVSSLLEFITLKPRPHRVHLPAPYEEVLRFIYEGTDDRRELRVSEQTCPARSRTRMETQYFDFARVARIALWEIGADLAEALDREENSLRHRGASVIQAWINLSQPWAGEAAETLRDRAYFLGGVLPRWFDADGLLMQKIFHRPHWEDMQIHYDRARRIVEIARQDWQRTGSGG
ncbi:MAG: hypothetical protein JW821_14315 [Deltaproteobacteria bacterium]|nr:hypothetical protein [Deltaproteobacteria bacterium]